jgi:protein required for attachment to host cells
MRSAMEQTDWHELGEMRFIAQVISELEAFFQTNSSQKLVLIAPPRILSYLRQQLPRSTKQLVQAEFDKDLVRLPLYEIERHLVPH